MGRPCGGFSLIEVMIVLALLALLASMGLPALHGQWQRQQLRLAGDSLQLALELARSESVVRARAITLCPSADGRDCAAGGGWEGGWIVRLEPLPTQSAAPLLLVQAAWPGLRIRTTANLAAGLRFDAFGGARTAADVPQFGHFELCLESGGRGRRLTLSRAGRLRWQLVDCPPVG